MPGKVQISVKTGPAGGKEFVFDQHDVAIFGRDPDCRICLPEDRTTSRHHFILEVNPPEARLRDLGSLNGTWVNGVKHGGREHGETPEEGARRQSPEVQLRQGDEIRVGENLLLVAVETAALCCECGKEIAQRDRERCSWIGGAFICDGCRGKLQKGQEVKAPERLRCARCGKEAPPEALSADRGGYVCPSCVEQVKDDPAALLMKLVQEAVKAKGEEAPKIQGYEVEKRLGIGGFGAVYLARHRKSGERVALKVMLARVAVDENSRKLFTREIEITRKLKHPNIVELLDHGSSGSAFYFTMSFCGGGNIGDLMRSKEGKLSPGVAGPLMLQVLDGLAHAHDNGIVHRDLKPENLLLDAVKGGFVAKVADLGLAKNFNQAGLSGMTHTGSYAGTPVYMPREQVIRFRDVKPASDVWSIGATFYYMLTAQLPRQAPQGKRLNNVALVLEGEIVPIRKRDSSIPKNMAEVIDQALIVDPKQRFQNAREMRKALEKIL